MSLLITPAEVDLKHSEYPDLIHGDTKEHVIWYNHIHPVSGNHGVQSAPFSASSKQHMPLPGWCGFAHVWGTYWPGQVGVGASLATRSYKQNSCYSTRLSKPGRNRYYNVIFIFERSEGGLSQYQILQISSWGKWCWVQCRHRYPKHYGKPQWQNTCNGRLSH